VDLATESNRFGRWTLRKQGSYGVLDQSARPPLVVKATLCCCDVIGGGKLASYSGNASLLNGSNRQALIIISPHRMHSVRVRSIATDTVWPVCVCLLVTIVSSEKTDEPINMPLGV